MTKCTPFVLLISLVLGFLVSSRSLSAAHPGKPNILFFLIDDLGWADVGCYGSTFHETPHIDRLAKQGMRFTDAYAASAICSPTRASILTGKYPSRIGITRATPQISLPLEEVTIAEALKETGYRTAHLGKWHLQAHQDPGMTHYPQAQGFEVNIGGHTAGQPGSYFYPYTSKKRKGNNVPDLEGGKPGEYLTDRLTDEAIKFIQHNDDRPFLLHMWYYSVHTPVTGKPEKIEKYKTKAASLGIAANEERQPTEIGGSTHLKVQNNPEYAAMVESMDENVGRLLQCLDDEGIMDNTIVIFSSDNGGLSNGKITSNLPLRAGKAWIYEGGIREPLIIKWPGVTTAGSICRTPVVSTDFYPTMLHMAGLELNPKQHLDGVSLNPLLTGAQKHLDRNALYFHLPVYHHVNTMGPVGAVRRGDYKLIQRFEDRTAPELYHLPNDLGERNNLAATSPEIVAELSALLDSWRKETGSTVPSLEEMRTKRARAVPKPSR